MWVILESHDAAKTIDRLPPSEAEKYALWCAIVRQSGPHGLRAIKSFHDEKLKGKLAHQRSSRLSLHWRVIYEVRAAVVTVTVQSITPHVYRR
jgi:proteic killer suppression protein